MEQLNSSSDEMLFGNIVDQLSSAAFLDVDTLESIAATIDDRLNSLEVNKIYVNGPDNSIDGQSNHDEGCSPDPLALNCFLTNIVQALKHNQGCEDSILREFLIFCSRNGFILPPVDSMMLDTQGSAVSLNTMTAEDEEIRISLWKQIRSKIKSGIIVKLRQSNLLNRLDYDQPGYQKEIQRRVQVIDLLMALFPVPEILEMYSTIREDQLDMYATGTKKYSVSWADEEGSEKIKELENLEAFVVTELDMLNMDIPILWVISKSLPYFNIMDFLEKVYFPRLQKLITKVVKSILERISGESGQSSGNVLLPTAVVGNVKAAEGLSWTDVQFMSKVFAIIWNWENEVTEIIGYFSVKDALQEGEIHGLRGVLKTSPNASPSLRRKQDRLGHIMWDEEKDKTKSKAALKWSWREQFKPVILTLAKHFEESLKNADAILPAEDAEINSTMLDVHDRLSHVNPNYPLKISKKYAILVSTFDEVLPLASHGGGPVFEPVREAFIEVFSACLRECHADLTEAVNAFTDCSGIEAIYKVLCSVTFMAQHLRFYEENIAVDESRPFRHMIKIYDELLVKTRSAIISCHLKVLSTMVLFDANSNNWTDNKQFHEGEKYSYCVQMWSYYLRCVHSDIWNKLPLSESKKILFEITNHSLIILVGRYSKVTPSFARTKQYSADISAICDVVVWAMWMLADSVSDLVSPQVNGPKMNQWHSLCSNLLANMIMISSPLRLIADYLTAEEDSPERMDKETFELQKLLLLWSEPCMFTKSFQSINDLGDREAVSVVFRKLVSSPTPDWSLVLQAILMRGALLPALVASNPSDFVQQTRNFKEDEYKNGHVNENFSKTKGYSLSVLDLPEFVSHVYDVLFKLSAKSDALAHFLMTLANCENTWNLFDNHIIAGAKETCETPKWLQNIEKSLMPYLSRSFLPSLEMICESDRLRCLPSFAFSNLETLPCGCTAVKDDKSNQMTGDGELLYQCLVSTLESLTESLSTMPRIIAVFFNRLNEYLYQRHFSAATKSPGLKILAFISYKWLTVQENIGLLFDFSISDATMGKIKCFAELVWHVLFNLTTDVSQNPSIPTEIMSYIKGRKSWLQEKLKLLTNYFKTSGVNSGAGCLDQMLHELADTQYTILTSTLMATPDGRESLMKIYDVLKVNKEKIEEKLLPGRTSEQPSKVCCKRTEEQKTQGDLFNPLKEYNVFGDYLHDQEESIELQRDWGRWMPVLDLFPVSVLRRIILQRQEFQPDSYSYLTEEEKVAHGKLIQFFGQSPSQPNGRPDSGSSEQSVSGESKSTQSNESK